MTCPRLATELAGYCRVLGRSNLYWVGCRPSQADLATEGTVKDSEGPPCPSFALPPGSFCQSFGT